MSAPIPDEFDRVLDDYEEMWIKGLDTLEKPFPFPAACLACVMLDHLGNARSVKEVRIEDHKDAYKRYIRKYLGPAGFPDNDNLRERFYRTLRSGLVHEGRTDDHTRHPQDAALVRLTHVSATPVNVGPTDDFIVSVPWLCDAVKDAWKKLRAVTDPSTRKRVAERLVVVIQEGTLPVDEPQQQEPSGLPNTTLTMPASGVGGNFTI